jgi:hypothetical protein
MKGCTITGKAADGRKINVSLAGVARLVAAHGTARRGSTDPTASSAGLDPAFACWLMGLPLAVDACAPMATPLSRNSAPPSSQPSSKQPRDEPPQPKKAKEQPNMNDNPFREAAASVRGRTSFDGTILRFKSGDWTAGKDNINMNDEELIALVDHLMFGWCKWQDGKPVDYHVGLARERFKPPHRGELGDNDTSKWERRSNERKDPWQLTYYVPLADPRTAQLYWFSTTTDGGKDAWADLSDAYADSQDCQDTVGKLPRVALCFDSYIGQHGGKVYKPIFKILGFEDPPPGLRPIRPPVSSSLALNILHAVIEGAAQPAAIEHKPQRNELDEDLPF